jgi:1-deoxy-D-xylulose-5-phosphate reductoisomerase
MMKKIILLGSTGSIGTQTLGVVRRFPQHLSILGMTAGKNISLLKQQISEFKPQYVYSQSGYSVPGCKSMKPELMVMLPEVDIVVIACSGTSALQSLLAAVKAGKVVALANKESLVSAGETIISEVMKNRAELRPVDSEHSAIWQCLNGEKSRPIRLILTASGGPFRNYSREELTRVTARQALEHPSWKMGQKVTIDSATLMNKGLEVLEAHYLFGMPFAQIDVAIHPQSIVHSLVEFGDGSLKAQLGLPDMRIPIQYALSFPERWDNENLPHLDMTGIARLDFEAPDELLFPCLKLAIEAGNKGGTYPAVLCSADEAAVSLFLEERIKFTDIASIIEAVLNIHVAVPYPNIGDVEEADRWAKEEVLRVIQKAGTYC